LTALSAFALHAGAPRQAKTATLSVTIKRRRHRQDPRAARWQHGDCAESARDLRRRRDGVQVFHRNKAAGTDGLESLAEDGNARLHAHLQGSRRRGPGCCTRQAFEVTARPGERLVFATMFVQSNDLFPGARSRGIALFELRRSLYQAMRRPRSGCGTRHEKNEAPGIGPDQARAEDGEQRPGRAWRRPSRA